MRRLAGALVLLVGLVAALGLSLRHLGAGLLPGCALDSPCERAIGGAFGTLPGVDWPVAFLGASWFGALLAAWLAAGAWPRNLVWAARLGGAASLGFLVLALVLRAPCPYCIAAQIASLGFVPFSERPSRSSDRGPARDRRDEVAFGLVFVIVTALLAVARSFAEREATARDERALAESMREAASGERRGFTGRYREGPERAAVRLVLFTDYQCPDCRRLDGEALALVAERADVSLSAKHFPLCSDCNRLARELGRNPHPAACRAARAAEAAGILGGDAAFWRLHRWLFERGGSFADADLRAELAELALDAGAFHEALLGAETEARVAADVEEALALGLQSTPAVFVNGVELRGWRAPHALRRAVEAVAASGASARGPEEDRPPAALEKCLEDWRLEPVVTVPRRAGEAEAADVVVWGDYLDGATRELDRRVRAFAAERGELRYSFRHYPLDPECVATAPAAHPGACRAARAAEAAWALGGEEGFARFHAWLIEARSPLDDAGFAEAARAAGLDPDELLAALSRPEALATVRADVEAARAIGITAIPFFFAGGKRVPRWRLEDTDLLERILSEALESR